MKPSPCGRFVILDPLHIDREVLACLESWGAQYGLRVQDAVQLAIVAFTDALLEHELAEAHGSEVNPS